MPISYVSTFATLPLSLGSRRVSYFPPPFPAKLFSGSRPEDVPRITNSGLKQAARTVTSHHPHHPRCLQGSLLKHAALTTTSGRSPASTTTNDPRSGAAKERRHKHDRHRQAYFSKYKDRYKIHAHEDAGKNSKYKEKQQIKK